jgi:2-polyprenyl-6-hydroxyphenyl methylase / 3-demethylubiquinone-9 3-methyltransferase
MPVIDNKYYDRAATSWRDGTLPLSLLDAFTPGRFAYLRGVLDRLNIDPAGKATLDVGCGGGLLAEEFARLGCCVTGVDPSVPSLRYAIQHAREAGLDIDYRQARGEVLPFESGTFDIVYCCDVLEHVQDLDRVVAETARVLKPGAIYLYDTVNRTLASKIVLIKLAQDWRPTRVLDFALHDWNMFIKPEELQATLSRHGLHNQETVGFGPKSGPLAMAGALWDFKRGRVTFRDLGVRLQAGTITSLHISYMGYATKQRD